MERRSALKTLVGAAALSTLAWIVPPAGAQGNTEAEATALRKIMRELGRNMQTVTAAISREDWRLVADTAPRIADHPQPPLAEKMRILAFVGSDAGRFRGFDEQTQRAALALGQAAARSDGQAVIASFAALQDSCLACHQNFRKPYLEHFHGPR